jgi:hypothetical protein
MNFIELITGEHYWFNFIFRVYIKSISSVICLSLLFCL